MRQKTIFFIAFLIVFAVDNIFAVNEIILLPKEHWAMNEDGQFAYATKITSDSITLQIELFSPQLKIQSQTAGLLVYIDLTGKKKEKYSVAFPVVKGLIKHMMPSKNHNERFDKRPEGESQKRREVMNVPMVDFDTLQIPTAVKPVLIGDGYASFFVDKNEQILSPEDVTLSCTDGRMFYSLKLPRTKFGKKINKKGICSVGVAIREFTMTPKSGGMTPPEGGMGGRPGGGMGGPGGGMGSRPGGGMGGPGGGMGSRPGGGMGGPGGSNSPHKQQYKQWLSVNCQ